ncbi:MAG: Transcription factor iws1 [Candelina mexicana]|nr:MAG: Transcription factor iws1 [Candelina mexicana]
MSSGYDSRPAYPEPEPEHEPSDSNQPVSEDKDTPPAPIGNPHEDLDAADDIDDLSDNESVLSDIDEAQFEDFDIENIAIEDRPVVAVDESNVNEIGVHKRKRAPGADEADGVSKKKKKEAKREKPKKSRKKRDDDDAFSGGEELEGKRARKKKDIGERKERARPRKRSPENEDLLDPAERRKRALDRAMDEALKNPNKRRRKHGEEDINDVEDQLDALRDRMATAAQQDITARDNNKPAMHKLKMLPEVVAMLNRNNIKDKIVDPHINFLIGVRFFLEPLNDGSLPAYNIQREIFSVLANLPIDKDSLIDSGIGKVVLFYTKSKKPELSIKRQAEKLLGEWTRPILKRSDNYRSKAYQEADFDRSKLDLAYRHASQQKLLPTQETPEQARERILKKPERNANRARIDNTVTSYTIVPRSNTDRDAYQSAKRVGAGGDDLFRRMKARQIAKAGGGARR